MRPKVFLTRKIPEAGIRLLTKAVDLDMNRENRVLTREELLAAVKGKAGILSLLTDHVDGRVMDAAPDLKVIANYAVGYDNIDLGEATRRGILVTNTPDVLTETTADFAWALLMAAARRISEADRFTRDGKFVGWDPLLLLGHDIHGKTLGIVGFGRIGRAMARRAAGFGMQVLYTDRAPVRSDLPSPDTLAYTYADSGASILVPCREVPLSELLAESDFVTIHTPLTPETVHLIGERELALMKGNAVLINTARGPVVDEAALAEALKAGAIAGAALDVFEREPAVTKELLSLPNCVLAPHIASASLETRGRMATMAAENLLAALEGKVPPNLVNRDALEVSR